MPKPICAIAALIAAMVGPVHAQFAGGDSQAVSDTEQIHLMRAQTDALHAYARCFETGSDARPCKPPQPIQMPLPPNQTTLAYRSGSTQDSLNAAQRDFIESQSRARSAYAQCLQTKPASICGPAP
jgi:hypothetical protein